MNPIPQYLLFLSFLLLYGCITKKEIAELQVDKSQRFPIGANGKWGFADENGQTIIPLTFDTVHLFSYGVAVAKLNGKYGYLKKDGTWHLKPKYDAAKDFTFDYTEVSVNGDSFFINQKGRRMRYKYGHSTMLGCLVFPPVNPERFFTKIEDHYALKYNYYVRQDSASAEAYGEVTDTFNLAIDEVIEYGDEHILVKKDNKYGFFHIWGVQQHIKDLKGLNSPNRKKIIQTHLATLIDFKYDEVTFDRPSENQVNFALCKIDEKYGVLNSRGEELMPPSFKTLKMYERWQMALVEYEPQKFGFIKFTGKEYFQRDL